MSRFGAPFKRVTRWDAVTKTRYTIGLWVAAIGLVLPTIILYYWNESIADIGGAPGWGFWVLLASTFAFICAVISMGAPLWSRIEAIVTWDAEIVLPEDRPYRHIWAAAYCRLCVTRLSLSSCVGRFIREPRRGPLRIGF
jgi:hypothetical protein